MYRLTHWITLVVLMMAFMAGLTAPAQAQGDFSPEEQAALDAAHQALTDFLALDSYSLTFIQDQDQTMGYTDPDLASDKVTRRTHFEGVLEFQRAPGQPTDNRSIDYTETATKEAHSGGEVETTDLGSRRIRLIVADGRVYMRFEVQSDTATATPGSWQDVTEDPSIAEISLDTMMQPLSFSYPDQYFASVIAVEIVDPDPADTQAAQRCVLTLDQARLVEAIGTETLASLIGASTGETDPAQLNAIIEDTFTDPATQYQLDVMLDANGALLAYGEHIIMGSESDAFIALTQNVIQTYRVVSANQPLTITAPDMTEE